MLSVVDFGPQVLGYRVEGKLERADIERVFTEMDGKLAAPGTINVYGEVHSLGGISLEALWEDVRMSVPRWKAVTRIGMAALVTEIEWLRRAAVWEERIFRGIDIRTFSRTEQAQAQAWVCE